MTDQVRSGANAFGAELGDGWWKGKIASFGFNHYGTSLGLIAQLRIDYTDGTSQVVKTDDTWTSHFGPYVQADNLEGETYDANARAARLGRPRLRGRRLEPGHHRDQHLRPPGAAARRARARHRRDPGGGPHHARARRRDLRPRPEHGRRRPDGRSQGQAGTTVRIRYGEELNPDGTLYTANLRSAKVTDRYTFARDRDRRRTPRSSPSTASATSRSPGPRPRRHSPT